jgi:hypothetical protein
MRASRLATILLLVPVVALGQGPAAEAAPEEAEPEARPSAPAEVRGDEVQSPVDPGQAASQLEGEVPEGDDGAAGAAADGGDSADTYRVQRGDTLWDLSGRFLNNPWYWPKVWSYNPQITNPHFIYPGNIVRLHPGAEGAPARLSSPEELGAPAELEDLSRADMKRPQEIGEGDEVSVVGPYKIGYVAPKGVWARHDTFVTQRELDDSGVISAAFEEKLLLTIGDRAYVRFKRPAPVKVGERYVIYKTDRIVRHPVTGERWGYKSMVLGAGKVVAVDEKVATIEIAAAFDPIERGDLVGPWPDKMVRQVRPRPNQRNLDGVILAAQQDLVSEIGEHHVVFIDKGKRDGVEEGNVFEVIRSGDPYGRPPFDISADPSLPDEDVATLLVFDVQRTASAALVIRSLRELAVGDHARMRASAQAAAGSGSR